MAAPFDRRSDVGVQILLFFGGGFLWAANSQSARGCVGLDSAGPLHSTEEIAQALKNTPIITAGQASPVAAQTLFGEDNLWFWQMAEHLQHNDPDILTAVIEFEQMHQSYDFRHLFPQIGCPTPIIQGSPAHRGMVNDEEIEQAMALLPPLTVARMKTVGHGLHIQDKEPVVEAIHAFLNTL